MKTESNTRLAVDSSDRVYGLTTTSVWRYDPATGATTAFAAPGTFGRDDAIAIDLSSGLVFLAQNPAAYSRPGAIIAFDLSTGASARVAGNGTIGSTGNRGPALSGAVYPWSLSVTPGGALVMTDVFRHDVRTISCGARGEAV